MQTLLNLTELLTALATETEVLDYLRYSQKIAEITANVEQDQLVLKACAHFGIDISELELQIAGDAFRAQNQLLNVSTTLDWLTHQRITVEDWSYGIRVQLLTQKLKDYLFSDIIDGHYMQNREDYRRVALSQILLPDLLQANQVLQTLQLEPTSFCAIALQHSQTKQSQKNGGFVGVRFVKELIASIAQSIDGVSEGAIVGPVQTRLGYHVIKVEKWYPTELSQTTRAEVLDTLFRSWVQEVFSKSTFPNK